MLEILENARNYRNVRKCKYFNKERCNKDIFNNERCN